MIFTKFINQSTINIFTYYTKSILTFQCWLLYTFKINLFSEKNDLYIKNNFSNIVQLIALNYKIYTFCSILYFK